MLYGIGCDLCELAHLEKSLTGAHAAAFVLREPFSLCEIEAVRQENGAPAYRFSGRTAEWVQARSLTARLSLSHEGGMALAFCTLEMET